MKTKIAPFPTILLVAFLVTLSCKEDKSKKESVEPQQMEKSQKHIKK